MQFPRVTIRRLLLVVAALAVVLGIVVALQRRSERFRALAAECAAAVHSVYFADVNGEDGTVLTASVADYHTDLSAMYGAAANRPWPPLKADEPQPGYILAFWFAHHAVKKAYPNLALGDYNVFVTADDSNDQAIWAVRYRCRDNRSGLTVFLRDPIEFEIHNDGPPPRTTQSENRGMGEG
jgi:hypothetical protein